MKTELLSGRNKAKFATGADGWLVAFAVVDGAIVLGGRAIARLTTQKDFVPNSEELLRPRTESRRDAAEKLRPSCPRGLLPLPTGRSDSPSRLPA